MAKSKRRQVRDRAYEKEQRKPIIVMGKAPPLAGEEPDPKFEWQVADIDYIKRYRREQRKHWPTGGDLTLWQLIKLVLFGRDK